MQVQDEGAEINFCSRERELLHAISIAAARKIMLHDSGPDNIILTILPALEAIWRWEREQKEQVGD